jgi:hypothetical protein
MVSVRLQQMVPKRRGHARVDQHIDHHCLYSVAQRSFGRISVCPSVMRSVLAGWEEAAVWLTQLTWQDHALSPEDWFLHRKLHTYTEMRTTIHCSGLLTKKWAPFTARNCLQRGEHHSLLGIVDKEVSISEPRSSGVYFITINRCSMSGMPTDAAGFSSYCDHSP